MPIEKRESETLPWLARTMQEGREVARAFKTRSEARDWLKNPQDPTWTIRDGTFYTRVKVPDNPPKPGGGFDPELAAPPEFCSAPYHNLPDIPMKPGKGGGLVVGMESDAIKTLKENFVNDPPQQQTLQVTPADFEAGGYIKGKNTATGRIVTLTRKNIWAGEFYFVEGKSCNNLAQAIQFFQQKLIRIGANRMEKVPGKVKV